MNDIVIEKCEKRNRLKINKLSYRSMRLMNKIDK